MTLLSMLAKHLVLMTAALLAGSVPLRTVHDRPDGLSFQLPADWPLSTRDRELSTFHDEARTAPHTARLRFVAAMPENPYPESTFSGAHFYVSVTPMQTAAQCAAQAGSGQDRVGVVAARRGHDEHGAICTQFRDDVYTLRRRGSCLRMDLAINNFCGGEVSGVKDLTAEQIAKIQARLRTILDSVQFDR